MLKKTFLITFAAITMVSASRAQQAAAPSTFIFDGKLFTAMYQQKAAEYKALCFQAYNFAHLRVDMALLKKSALPRVIVTDIDETIFDNSPNAVHQAMQNKDFEPGPWAEWTAMAKADSIPGSVSFLKYAASKGIQVYYITNRSETERVGTLKNLQLRGYPNADNAHLILHQDGTPNSKETRRQQVAKTHNIILLMGDNLADFSALFDQKSTAVRNQTTREQAAMFGKKFIIIPNPNYGDWESSLYNYQKLTPAQREDIIKKDLINQN